MQDHNRTRRIAWGSVSSATLAVFAAVLALNTNLIAPLVPEAWIRQHGLLLWMTFGFFVLATVALGVRESGEVAKRRRKLLGLAVHNVARKIPLNLPSENMKDTRPSSLLHPDRMLIDFRGRGVEKRRLLTWTLEESSSRFLTLYGPPHTGKSRLVNELAKSMPAEVGVFRSVPGREAKAFAAISEYHRRAVVVVEVDEASADLRTLLDDVASAPTARIRVLLVSRGSTLGTHMVGLADSVIIAVRNGPSCELLPHGGREDRERWFYEAVDTFRSALEENSEESVHVTGKLAFLDLGPIPIGVLHAYALSLLLSQRSRTIDSETISHALAEHEMRRWRSLPRAVSENEMRTALAVAWLLGDSDRECAAKVIQGIFRCGPEAAFDMATWIAHAYPRLASDSNDGGASRALDLVSHALVLPVLSNRPEIVSMCAKDCPRLTRFALAVQIVDAGSFDRVASDLAARALPGVNPLDLGMLKTAIKDTAKIDGLLANFLCLNPPVGDELRAWVRELGEAPELKQAAIVVTRLRAVESLRSVVRDEHADALEQYAVALNRLKGASGLYAAREALRIRRTEGQFGGADERVSTARSLRTLALSLLHSGFHAEAATTALEAVESWWALWERDGAQHLSGVAEAVADQIDIAVLQARGDEAASLASRIVRVATEVGEGDVASEAGRKLVPVFVALAGAQLAIGESEAAIANYRAALCWLERDAGPALPRVLMQLGSALSSSGLYAAALVELTKAVDLLRRELDGTELVAQGDLAAALHAQGATMDYLGDRPEAALSAFEGALKIIARCAVANFARYGLALATIRTSYGVVLGKLGRVDEGIEQGRISIELIEELSNRYQVLGRDSLAIAHNSYANRLHAFRKLDLASRNAARAVQIARELAASTLYGRSLLAITLNTKAAILAAMRSHTEALAASTESVAIWRQLRAQDSLPHARSYLEALLVYESELTYANSLEMAVLIRLEADAVQEQLRNGRHEL